MAERRRGRRPRQRQRAWAFGVGAVVVAAAAGIAVWATAASGATGYRTAAATTATVEKTLTVSGTADPVDQATAGFQVPGTVSAVDVTAGQSVTVGQTLASLDTTTLQQAVTSAEITLNAAKAKLTEDEAAQAASTTTTTTTAPTTTTTTTTTTSAKGNGTLQQAQQAVVNAQQTADTATQQAASAQAQTACGAAPTSETTTTTTTTPGTTPKHGTSTAAKGPTGTTPSGTTPSGTTATCADARKAALADQEQVSTDQKAVGTAESSLAQLLAASGSGSSPGSGTGQPSGSGGTGASGTQKPTVSSTTTTTRPASGGSSPGGTSNRPGSPSSATGSAARLASDQAAIDTATASLIEAQQDLGSAQLTSPIAGTVVSVGLAAGQTVSAGSTTDAITVISAGSFEVTASVTSTQAAELKVGDAAEVTVNGTTGALEGTVARVGPADTTGSSITYPVVVALPAGAHDIRSGSTAEANIVLRRAEDVLVVPTSAVHTAGTGNSYVTVLQTAGQAAHTPVSVGIVGSIYTQITSGLTKGATVVLADRSAPLPSSNTNTSPGGLGGTGSAGGHFISRQVVERAAP